MNGRGTCLPPLALFRMNGWSGFGGVRFSLPADHVFIYQGYYYFIGNSSILHLFIDMIFVLKISQILLWLGCSTVPVRSCQLTMLRKKWSYTQSTGVKTEQYSRGLSHGTHNELKSCMCCKFASSLQKLASSLKKLSLLRNQRA